jgi:hypothetical protein
LSYAKETEPTIASNCAPASGVEPKALRGQNGAFSFRIRLQFALLRNKGNCERDKLLRSDLLLHP